MTTYQRPLQPWDPLVPDQQPKPPIRYVRDNFNGTGQDSHTQPPAQDPAMWQALTNVQPITKGVIEPRWGYNQLAALTGTPNRLYNFQSDALGTRSILSVGSTINAFNENGTTYRASLFNPTATPVRSATSRNFQYFCDGNNVLNPSTHLTGDSLKWDGSVAGAMTNIGIVATDVTSTLAGGGSGGSGTVGPNTGSTASDISYVPNPNPWTTPANIFLNNPATPTTDTFSDTWTDSGFGTYTLSASTSTTDTIKTTGYGFSSFVPPTVAGIQVNVTYNINTSLHPQTISMYAQLIKNGAAVGSVKNVTLVTDGTNRVASFGSASDLWGASFVPTDIIATNFGVQIYLLGGAMSPDLTGSVYHGDRTFTNTLKLSYITITVTGSGTSGTSSSSGNGVGILSVVPGGAINLVLGRTYYMVANTSAVGHFSDLTVSSGASGVCNNSEINLLLAQFNDPQVDTKYVLATTDGSDPSILYEVQVLIPGLTVTSWAIAANVVTFTGTYTGSPPANGSTVVVGGLSHGSYMNGQTLTVTSTTGTTLVAAFTHANDSATEFGIVGNYSFAIPNGITRVVDNTSDPNLVLNQPLLFTDQSGSEFGVANNDPPPAGTLICKHQGRLWMAGVAGASHSVFYSKSISELTLPNGFIAGKYEEAWPGSNYFDVSDGAESVAGLLSDGTTLYMGTQNHIRRLIGDDPINFQLPQIVHPNVGLLNQEVWQLVFTQGSPAGSIWMTPDFRVIQSDFNTYVDIGRPIQDILNAVQTNASSLAHATFVADGEYDLYILAVPSAQTTYCDLHLIYDLRSQKWFVWQPTSGSLALLYNITATGAAQWLFISGDGTSLKQYKPGLTTDSGTVFTTTAQTSWMSLGELTQRKILNEIDYDGDPALKITVNGALVHADFATPTVQVTNLASVLGPLGTRKFYLAGSSVKARYYQFAFSSNSGAPVMLGSYNIESIPVNDL